MVRLFCVSVVSVWLGVGGGRLGVTRIGTTRGRHVARNDARRTGQLPAGRDGAWRVTVRNNPSFGTSQIAARILRRKPGGGKPRRKSSHRNDVDRDPAASSDAHGEHVLGCTPREGKQRHVLENPRACRQPPGCRWGTAETRNSEQTHGESARPSSLPLSIPRSEVKSLGTSAESASREGEVPVAAGSTKKASARVSPCCGSGRSIQ